MTQNLPCNTQKLQRLRGFPLGKGSRWFCEDCTDFVIFLRSPRNHFWGFVRGSPYGLCWLLLHADARVANLHLPVRFPMDQAAEPKQIAEWRLSLWSFLLLFSGSHLLPCARIQPYIHYSYNKNNTSVNVTMPGNRNHTYYEYIWNMNKLFLLFWGFPPFRPLGGTQRADKFYTTSVVMWKVYSRWDLTSLRGPNLPPLMLVASGTHNSV